MYTLNKKQKEYLIAILNDTEYIQYTKGIIKTDTHSIDMNKLFSYLSCVVDANSYDENDASFFNQTIIPNYEWYKEIRLKKNSTSTHSSTHVHSTQLPLHPRSTN